MFKNYPKVPTEELLSQIKGACTQTTGGNIDQMSLITPPVSALLVKLSNEASETAEKNTK